MRQFIVSDRALAIGGLLVAVVAVALVLIFQGPGWIQTATTRTERYPYRDHAYIGTTDHAVTMTGMITDQAVQTLRADFQQAPTRHTLILSSPGGLVSAALELSRFIETHHLDVSIVGTCQSQCLLVLAAGQHKIVQQSSHLTLSPMSSDDWAVSSVPADQRAPLIERYYQRLITLGMQPRTIDTVKENGKTVFTLQHAYANHLITDIQDQRTLQRFPVPVFCAQTNASRALCQNGPTHG